MMFNRFTRVFNASRGKHSTIARRQQQSIPTPISDSVPTPPSANADSAVLGIVVADTPFYWDTNTNAMIMTGDMLYTGDKRHILGEDATHRWVQVMMNGQLPAWAPRANFNFRGVPPVVS
jgi:hypothetical protein